MRERIEDLGRILELLNVCLNHELFDLISCRTKDFEEEFQNYSDQHKEDVLNSLAYGITYLEEKLTECLEIAKGEDYLNLHDDS